MQGWWVVGLRQLSRPTRQPRWEQRASCGIGNLGRMRRCMGKRPHQMPQGYLEPEPRKDNFPSLEFFPVKQCTKMMIPRIIQPPQSMLCMQLAGNGGGHSVRVSSQRKADNGQEISRSNPNDLPLTPINGRKDLGGGDRKFEPWT